MRLSDTSDPSGPGCMVQLLEDQLRTLNFASLKSHFDPQDLFRRYQQYCVDAVAQRLFPEFRSLRAWHFRYVLGSWHSDADLAWLAAQMDETWYLTLQIFSCCRRSRDNVSQQYRKPETIGETTKMVKYKPYNEAGPI